MTNNDVKRLNVRFPGLLYGRLLHRARKDHLPANSVVLSAVAEYLGDEDLTAIAYRELTRNSDQLSRVERKTDLLVDVLLNLTQFWFAHAPEIDDPQIKAQLRKRSLRQYDDFLRRISRAVESRELSGELWALAADNHYGEIEE